MKTMSLDDLVTASQGKSASPIFEIKAEHSQKTAEELAEEIFISGQCEIVVTDCAWFTDTHLQAIGNKIGGQLKSLRVERTGCSEDILSQGHRFQVLETLMVSNLSTSLRGPINEFANWRKLRTLIVNRITIDNDALCSLFSSAVLKTINLSHCVLELGFHYAINASKFTGIVILDWAMVTERVGITPATNGKTKILLRKDIAQVTKPGSVEWKHPLTQFRNNHQTESLLSPIHQWNFQLGSDEKIDAELFEGIELDDELKHFKGITSSWFPAFAQALDHLVRLPELEYIQLEGWDFKDEHVKLLTRAKKLRVLRLSRTNIGDETIRVLENLPQLEEIVIEHSSISDRCIASLEKIQTLRALGLHHTWVSLGALSRLKNLPNVEILDLREFDLGSNPEDYFSGWKALKTVFVSGDTGRALTPILKKQGIEVTWKPGCSVQIERSPRRDWIISQGMTDDDMVGCSQFYPGLREAYLFDSRITDRGVAELVNLKNLSILNLSDANITKNSIYTLLTLTNLRELFIWRVKIAPEDLIKLKDLPNLQVLQIDHVPLSNDLINSFPLWPALKKVAAYSKEMPYKMVKMLREGGLEVDWTWNIVDREVKDLVDDDIEGCHESEELREIDLSSSKISDLSISYLSRVSQLQILNLKDTKITRQSIDFIVKMSALTHLDVSDTQLQIEDILRLKSLPQLKSLKLGNLRFNSSLIKSLPSWPSLGEIQVGGNSLSSGQAEWIRSKGIRVELIQGFVRFTAEDKKFTGAQFIGGIAGAALGFVFAIQSKVLELIFGIPSGFLELLKITPIKVDQVCAAIGFAIGFLIIDTFADFRTSQITAPPQRYWNKMAGKLLLAFTMLVSARIGIEGILRSDAPILWQSGILTISDYKINRVEDGKQIPTVATGWIQKYRFHRYLGTIEYFIDDHWSFGGQIPPGMSQSQIRNFVLRDPKYKQIVQQRIVRTQKEVAAEDLKKEGERHHRRSFAYALKHQVIFAATENQPRSLPAWETSDVASQEGKPLYKIQGVLSNGSRVNLSGPVKAWVSVYNAEGRRILGDFDQMKIECPADQTIPVTIETTVRPPSKYEGADIVFTLPEIQTARSREVAAQWTPEPTPTPIPLPTTTPLPTPTPQPIPELNEMNDFSIRAPGGWKRSSNLGSGIELWNWDMGGDSYLFVTRLFKTRKALKEEVISFREGNEHCEFGQTQNVGVAGYPAVRLDYTVTREPQAEKWIQGYLIKHCYRGVIYFIQRGDCVFRVGFEVQDPWLNFERQPSDSVSFSKPTVEERALYKARRREAERALQTFRMKVTFPLKSRPKRSSEVGLKIRRRNNVRWIQ